MFRFLAQPRNRMIRVAWEPAKLTIRQARKSFRPFSGRLLAHRCVTRRPPCRGAESARPSPSGSRWRGHAPVIRRERRAVKHLDVYLAGWHDEDMSAPGSVTVREPRMQVTVRDVDANGWRFHCREAGGDG